MKLRYKLSNLLLILFFSFFSIIVIAQPAGSPVYYEGEIYTTVIIGNQCWMSENLNVGTMINGVTMPTNNGVIEKLCYNNNPLNCILYGGLYRWNELMQYVTTTGTQGICPTGWHIPSDPPEWNILTNYYGDYLVVDPLLILGGITSSLASIFPVILPSTNSINESLTICFRKGGESFHPAGRQHSQRLKKLLQEKNVPPWDRASIPLVYFKHELIAVVGLWVGKQYAVRGDEEGWLIGVEGV